jgi:hypothetical protein
MMQVLRLQVMSIKFFDRSLELSLKTVALNNPSIAWGKYGEPQEDTLDDDLLILLPLSSWLFMTVGTLLLGMWSVSNLGLQYMMT